MPMTKKTPKTKRKPTRPTSQTRSGPEYSTEFTPEPGTTGHTYKLKRIPAWLYRRMMKKKTRHGVSIRAFLLRELDSWTDPNGATR